MLDLIGELPTSQMQEVWDAAAPMAGTDLRDGVWLGRYGGLAWPIKRIVRHVVRRDYFARLVFPGWGVNVRVKQDGTYAMIPWSAVPVGVRVHLPFRRTNQGLDYGYHVTGIDVGPSSWLPAREVLRKIDFSTLSEVVSLGHLRRVGVWRGKAEHPGQLVVGYLAPVGVEAFKHSPFAMVWRREMSTAEVRSAEHHIHRMRLWDTSAGSIDMS